MGTVVERRGPLDPDESGSAEPDDVAWSLDDEEGEDDDRPVPELGLGDAAAAAALVAALRMIVRAHTGDEVAVAVARFVRRLGGRPTPAADDPRDVIPLDIALGTGPPLLAVADPMSVARMRLEQYLPSLVEDARAAVSRLAQLDDMSEAVSRDALTGLLSRREMWRVLASARPGDLIVMMDLDRFKQVNDRQGHGIGDRVLAALGRLLARQFRREDRVGRYGGDELIALVRSVTAAAGTERLARLRTEWARVRPVPVTFSAGVAVVEEAGWEAALRLADAALYEAKRLGRDRTVVSEGSR